MIDFRGKLDRNELSLAWKVQDQQQVKRFDIQRSEDGVRFRTIASVDNQSSSPTAAYSFQQANDGDGQARYYRIKLVNIDYSISYSSLLRLFFAQTEGDDRFVFYPNPVKEDLHIQVVAQRKGMLKADIYDASGRMVKSVFTSVNKGVNTVAVESLSAKITGFCLVVVQLENEVIRKKIMLVR